jgi:hypothetical protein
MKKITIYIFFSILISFLSAEWVTCNSIENNKLITIDSQNFANTTLSFKLDGFSLNKEEEFYRLNYEGESRFEEFGKPDLPRFSRLIAIPHGAIVDFNYTIVASEKQESILVAPYTFTDDKSQQFVRENDYNSDEFFPKIVVQISEVVSLRDFELINVTINPFQYNPGRTELIVHHDIKININFKNGMHQYHAPNRKKSRYFEPLYQAVIANYHEISNREDEYQTPSYLFIYANNTSVENALQPLLQWKKQKGFQVKAVSTTIAGSSASMIKNYIQNAYNNWENPPEFICLVGDADGQITIPTEYSNSGEGDHYYTLLSGNDILADVYIGRLSIDSPTDLQTIVSKILNYEKQPYTVNPQWLQRALLIGDPSSSGYSTISVNKYIKETISFTNPEFEFVEGYSGNYVNTISNSINQGVSFFNYRGFAGMSGWQNSNTQNLNNGYMLPFVLHLTCNTGNFASYEEARSEIFLRAGSPSLPKGAIAAVGTATPNTHTTFNNLVAAATFKGIFIEDIHTAGGALTRGKTALFYHYPENPMNAVFNFSYWNNLMGDPGLVLWTAKPKSINLDFPEIISIGTNYVEIIVTDNDGQFVENVWVTALRNDDIFFSAYTNESGSALLDVFTEISGEITITASKHNCIPVIRVIDVQQIAHYVGVEQVIVIDDNSGNSSGNSNGHLNPGELLELKPKLKNYGTSFTAPLTATLATDNDFVTVQNNEINYNSIPVGSGIFPNENFLIAINENAPNKMEVTFHITIHDENRTIWQDTFQLNIQAAELLTTSYTVLDGNNGIAEPGENIQLKITIQNIGEIAVTNLQGYLSSENNLLNIINVEGSFGTIHSNATGNNNNSPFNIIIKPLMIPGTQVPMNLHLYNSAGFSQITRFHLNIGLVTVTDPYGPDEYGYYAYDDSDVNYLNVPAYEWYEIDPNFGGSGTVLSMYDNGDNGALANVNLPFVFPFYGENYSMITVCSNGFIVPGGTENFDYMNRIIPGPSAPAPLIAPFWDDLKMGTGRICYYYDNGQHLFIVQWSRLQNDYNGAEETFQAILFNPSFYPTNINSGMVKFQYKVINNVNQGQYSGYSVQHGQYATVGLQDHTQTRGLQYTYNNSYPTAAKPLQNEMAILFTGGQIAFEDAFIVLGGMSVYNDNGNNQLDFNEQASLGIMLNNIGESNAENVYATISTNDPFLTIQSNQAYYGTIAAESSGMNFEPFQVTVSNQVPNGHIAPVLISVTSEQGSWELLLAAKLHAPNFIYSSFLVNDGENYMFDPGETSDVFILLENIGASPVSDVSVILTSASHFVTIHNNTDTTSYFEGNMSESFLFNISISPSVTIGTSISFQVELTGSNYQIAIPFIMNIGLSIEDFESGTFDTYPWQFSGTGQWQISGLPYQGLYSAQSPDINDNQSTSLTISVNYSTSGQISFYKKVSSEQGWDYFRFLVNGQVQGEWSGEVSWSQSTFTIPAGSHVLEWRYVKDNIISSGSDCVWLDYIIFPMSAQQTAPVLEFSESAFDLEMGTNEQITETFMITNSGGLVSQYMISTEPEFVSWLTITPLTGYVVATETDVIYLHFHTASLVAGEYNAEISIFDDRNEFFIPIHLLVTATDNNEHVLPTINALLGNYPNPFNPATSISFSLANTQHTKLTIYNVKGQKVKTLVNEILSAGQHQIQWQGTDEKNQKVSSGMYLYRLETGGLKKTKKMLLLK